MALQIRPVLKNIGPRRRRAAQVAITSADSLNQVVHFPNKSRTQQWPRDSPLLSSQGPKSTNAATSQSIPLFEPRDCLGTKCKIRKIPDTQTAEHAPVTSANIFAGSRSAPAAR